MCVEIEHNLQVCGFAMQLLILIFIKLLNSEYNIDTGKILRFIHYNSMQKTEKWEILY